MARTRRVDPDEQLTLVEHLDELRTRLIITLSALAIGIAVGFWQSSAILAAAKRPAEDAVGHHLQYLQTGPLDAFMASMSVSFYVGLLVALPIASYQIYSFVIPAFSREHHRAIRPLAMLMPLLFALGAAFGWYVVIPPAMNFLLNFNASDFNVQLRASNQISFVVLTMAAMGLIFEMPAIMFTLAKMHIVTGPRMRRTWRYAVVILALVAGILPGADPVSFVAEFVPLLVLYGASYLIVVGVDRSRARNAASEHEAEPA
ncbi:MAG: twin-arginine translocase subunit TatC [Gaiellales bacterium]